jgi:NTP pyrophosphatase (non-canonical NTP hydrolase)
MWHDLDHQPGGTMSDASTSVQELKDLMGKFVKERGWEKHHSPKNLGASMAIEVAELMEHFQWLNEEESRAVKSDKDKMAHVKDEIADVASYLFSLCNMMDVDLTEAMKAKMEKNMRKYPSGTDKKEITAYTYLKRQGT